MAKEAMCLHFLLLTGFIIWRTSALLGHKDIITGVLAARCVTQKLTGDVKVSFVNKTLQLMKYYKQVQREILTQEDSANTSYGVNTTLHEVNATLTEAFHWVRNVTSFSFLSCEDEFYSYLMEVMILRKIQLALKNLYKTIQPLESHKKINTTTWLDERMSYFPNATQAVIKNITC